MSLLMCTMSNVETDGSTSTEDGCSRFQSIMFTVTSRTNNNDITNSYIHIWSFRHDILWPSYHPLREYVGQSWGTGWGFWSTGLLRKRNTSSEQDHQHTTTTVGEEMRVKKRWGRVREWQALDLNLVCLHFPFSKVTILGINRLDMPTVLSPDFSK